MSLEDIDDETRDELAQLANKLANSPSTRNEFLRLARKASPDMSIPELDMQDNMNAAMKPFQDKISSLENKLYEKEVTDRIMSNRQNLIDSGKISREDIPEIEKLMVDKKIPDYNTATEFYRLQKESAKPTPGMYQPKTPMVDVKKIGNNPTMWARDEASKAISELMQNRNH